MKNTVLIIFLLSFYYSLAQTKPVSKPQQQKNNPVQIDTNNCDNYIQTTTDRVTGRSYNAIKDVVVASNDGRRNSIIIDAMTTLHSYILIFDVDFSNKYNCIDKGSTIYILFRDGSRIQLDNEEDFNCQGKAKAYLQPSDTVFSEKEIEIIRIIGYKNSFEVALNKRQSQYLKYSLRCLFNQW